MLHGMFPAPQQLRTYFTTFTTSGRRRLFQVEKNAELMVETLETYRVQGRLSLHAFVVMPDHVHALITPATEVSLEKAIQFMKGGFSFRLKSRCEVWERVHFDKRVPDRQSYDACVTYIHRNPVAANMVSDERVYAFSSAGCSEKMDPAPDWFPYEKVSPGLKPFVVDREFTAR